MKEMNISETDGLFVALLIAKVLGILRPVKRAFLLSVK